MAVDRDRLMRRYAPRLTWVAPQSAALVMGDLGDTTPVQKPVQKEPTECDESGVMVAFYPDRVTAAALALDLSDCDMGEGQGEGVALPDNTDPIGGQGGGDILDIEEPDELHLTLAYLGQAHTDIDAAREPALIEAVTGWARTHQPVSGVTSGMGLFHTPEGAVTYASVDSAALPQARQDLISALAAAGFEANTEHGFTPHITLAYGDARMIEVAHLPVRFATVSVAFAGARTDIPMGVPAPAVTVPGHIDTARARLDYVGPAPRQVTGTSGSGATVAWTPLVTTVGSRTVITAPATTELAAMWDAPPNPNKHMMWMQGRFVGAERANKNGAFWSTSDLELGRPTVAHGPLNWLHEDRHVIGAIADAKFVPVPGAGGKLLQVAAETGDPHLAAMSAIWSWLYPDEASIVQMASDSGVLAYSMECISEAVQCMGDAGCGQQYSFMDYAHGAGCDHLKASTSVRRLVNPTFLGGAVIVPPTRPGWADSNATVMKRATAMAEKAYDSAGRPDMPATTWEQLMAGVLTYADSPR